MPWVMHFAGFYARIIGLFVFSSPGVPLSEKKQFLGGGGGGGGKLLS